MKRIFKCFFNSFVVFSMLSLFSCVSSKVSDSNIGSSKMIGNPKDVDLQNSLGNITEIENPKAISRNLIAMGKKSPKKLYKFFIKNNKQADRKKVRRMAQYYYNEARAEGINSDVAFIQMCHETGFLRFGNLVTVDMNNFCGLGSEGEEKKGESFATEELGVRAHIQHLQAYATTEDVPLQKELVDPRYNWVHKTKFVEDIFGLTKTWAMDPNYGKKLDELLTELEKL